MPTVEEILNTLKDMGFTEERAKKALAQTGWNGVEAAMEWLLAHPDDDGEMDDEPLQATDNPEATPAVPAKVLTEEEKQEQLKRLEELRVKKRKERLEQERKDELDREKRRVQDGKAMGDLKQQLEEQEMKKIAAERRREKLETQRAKERVKAQIAADRQARKDREAMERGEVVAPPPKPASQPAATSSEPKKYDQTRIQIRQTDGKPMVQTFQAKEPLSAVKLYAEMNRQDFPGVPVKLMTNLPRKVFEGEDYETPLDVLGLVPSAVLMITKS